MRAVLTEKTRTQLWEPDMLPEPSSIFTIPSTHDDVQLECRIYHAKQSKHSTGDLETRVVTIAHPYTPMGGCCDDHVLHAAGLEFLKHGYILGLFNLRGAGKSKGHNSWSSKPEQDDYISFVGLLTHYLDELHQRQSKIESSSALEPIVTQIEATAEQRQSRIADNTTDQSEQQRVLVMGGYSYGSFIVRQLPDISTVIAHFSKPEKGSAAAEIRLRAAHLASERMHELQASKPRGRSLRVEAALGSPVFGGDESEPGTRRVSRESRRSVDAVRRTMEKSRAHFTKHRSTSTFAQDSESSTLDVRAITIPETRYLLISPILSPLSAFLALSSRWWKHDPDAEQRLRAHHSFAVWGDGDFFTSGRRLAKWAKSIEGQPGSNFSSQEVTDAGHFWLEQGAEAKLRQAIRQWIERLDGT